MKIENLAPDTDVIMLTSNDGYVTTISRDEDGKVWVVVEDHIEGGESMMVLGSPGITES